MLVDEIRALVFDVFGTCVDWRGSVIRELAALGRAKGITGDWSLYQWAPWPLGLMIEKWVAPAFRPPGSDIVSCPLQPPHTNPKRKRGWFTA